MAPLRGRSKKETEESQDADGRHDEEKETAVYDAGLGRHGLLKNWDLR